MTYMLIIFTMVNYGQHRFISNVTLDNEFYSETGCKKTLEEIYKVNPQIHAECVKRYR